MLFLSIVYLFLSLTINCLAHMEQSLLLVVSLDGFRHDYIEVAKKAGEKLPNFDYLIDNGLRVNEVTNVFITKTIPNHFTLITGLYEETHGMVGNSMYDPIFDEYFDIENSTQSHDPKWWNNGEPGKGAEPIWITNEKASGELLKKRSGVVMWPGSTIHCSQSQYSKNVCLEPDRVVEYDRSVTFEKRIDYLVDWFSTEDRPINLGLVYFHEPDHTGHIFGPDSQEVVAKIKECDDYIGYIIQRFREVHLLDDINIIITSDHGMTNVIGYIELNDHIPPELYTTVGNTDTVLQLIPKDEAQTDWIYQQLQDVEHMDIYKRDYNIPNEYHYNNNRRIAPLLVVAEKGYIVGHNISEEDKRKGQHGHDNRLPDMHPIFIGYGPEFPSGVKVDSFHSIDMYELMCHILDIEPATNNGSLHRAHELLEDESEGLGVTFVTFLLAVGFAATVSAVMCVAACQVHRYIRRTRALPVHLADVSGSIKTTDIDAKKGLLISSDEEEIP